jgi:large subunit ribosomal protein L10
LPSRRRGTDYEGIVISSPVRRRSRLGRSGRRRQGGDFAKTTDKIEIVGGVMGPVSTRKGSRRSPRCRRSTNCAPLIGLIQAPATKIAQLATAPAAKLARVFGAYAKEAA